VVLVMTATYWRDDAACAGMDTDIFFPLSSGDPRVAEATRLNVRVAKAICNDCPVIAACLQEAIRLGDVHGIFGGLTGKERREMSRPPRTDSIAQPRNVHNTRNTRNSLSSKETVQEVLHLWDQGMTREDISQSLGKSLQAIEKCFMRAGVKAPFGTYVSVVGANR